MSIDVIVPFIPSIIMLTLIIFDDKRFLKKSKHNREKREKSLQCVSNIVYVDKKYKQQVLKSICHLSFVIKQQLTKKN